MRWNHSVVLISFVTLVCATLAQSVVTDADMIEFDRRIAENHKTTFPLSGVVPNEETARAIALAVAIPIWGKDKVNSELPPRAG